MSRRSAQLDREIAAALAGHATRRDAPEVAPPASAVVKKLLGGARRLVNARREDGRLRDADRTIGKLEALAAEAIEAAERELAAVQLPVGYEDVWAARFDDARGRVADRAADLRALIADPVGYAQGARQRFSETTSPDLATALYYVSAFDDLVPALRRVEAMAKRR